MREGLTSPIEEFAIGSLPKKEAQNKEKDWPEELVKLKPEFDPKALSNLPFSQIGKKEHYEDDAIVLTTGITRFNNFVVENNIDTIFFLDKSARPAGFLFLETWNNIYPGIKPPDIRFLDVGRDETDIKKRKYEGTFAKEGLKKMFSTSTRDKRVCIADELIQSGDTIAKAKKLFEEVFPDTKQVICTGIFNDMPSWYGNRLKIGVTEPNLASAIDRFTYLGGFLNKPVAAADRETPEETILLRKDLNILAKAIAQNIERAPIGSFHTEPLIPNDCPYKPYLIGG